MKKNERKEKLYFSVKTQVKGDFLGDSKRRKAYYELKGDSPNYIKSKREQGYNIKEY